MQKKFIAFFICSFGVLLPNSLRVIYSEILGWISQFFYFIYATTLKFMLKQLGIKEQPESTYIAEAQSVPIEDSTNEIEPADDEIVVLFSGGSDSTLAAALCASNYRKVHLVSFYRLGFFSIQNTQVNFEKLQDKFGHDKYDHQIISYDQTFKLVCYERYFQNLAKHGFFLLSTCGLCKLAMHVRAAAFCIENNITNVCDGANKGMDLFPAQMPGVIEQIKNMYASVGINYTNPVFDYEGPQNMEFLDKLKLRQTSSKEQEVAFVENIKKTTGYRLFNLGLMPSVNVKGTKIDRKMQFRCFQLILFNVFVKWWYLPNHSYAQYEKATVDFFAGKASVFTEMLADFSKNTTKSKLARHLRR